MDTRTLFYFAVVLIASNAVLIAFFYLRNKSLIKQFEKRFDTTMVYMILEQKSLSTQEMVSKFGEEMHEEFVQVQAKVKSRNRLEGILFVASVVIIIMLYMVN